MILTRLYHIDINSFIWNLLYSIFTPTKYCFIQDQTHSKHCDSSNSLWIWHLLLVLVNWLLWSINNIACY